MKRIAMEYSPGNAIPYISKVDAGTIEMVKKTGVEVVSSMNLAQYFESRWPAEAYRDNLDTAAATSEGWRLTRRALHPLGMKHVYV